MLLQRHIRRIVPLLGRTVRNAQGFQIRWKHFAVRSGESASIIVDPTDSLVDDDSLSIRIENLKPLENITLYSEITEGKFKFGALSHYVSDPIGVVDLRKNASVGGSYIGVEPLGPIWAMEQLPGQKQGLRLMKKDVSEPFVIEIKIYDKHLKLGAILDPKSRGFYLGGANIRRRYKETDVERIPVSDGQIRGVYFRPAGDGPFPGVIDMFGSAGGCMEHRAALLASRGIASLALGFFDYEDLPPTFHTFDINYFIEAADWLRSRPEVKSDKGVGVIGVSKGAEIGIMMSEVCDYITAVVAINSLAHNSICPMKMGDIIRPHVEADFVHKPFLPEEGFCVNKNSVLPPVEVDPKYELQIEKSETAKFLFIVGENDLGSHPLHTFNLVDRLQRNGRKNYDVVYCHGAGHLIEPPYTAMTRWSYHKHFKRVGDNGGQLALHAKAQEMAWRKTLKFFKSILI